MKPRLFLASGSGNRFAYGWRDELPGLEGAELAQRLCPGEVGLGVDGLFLMDRPREGKPWLMDHWEPDGGCTFCGNGTRTAMAIPGAPEGEVEVMANGQAVALRRQSDEVALRMPSGPGFGFRPSPLDRKEPHACAWIGNPQLILEVPDVEAIDLAAFAPPLRHHPAFEHGTNVCIVQVEQAGHARIRSWERGVEGETLSCGTGSAVAGAWLASRWGISEWEFQPRGKDRVRVEAVLDERGDWRSLWLSGRVRLLGQFEPTPQLVSLR